MAVLTEEQSMLRDAAKSWVQEKSPVTAFRKMRDSGAELGYDVAAWNEMAEMSVNVFAFNGGIRIREDAGSTVPRLYACGESSGGMHSADRLGGNAFASTQVFGRRAGMSAAHCAGEDPAPEPDPAQVKAHLREMEHKLTIGAGPAPSVVRRKIQDTMWWNAMICQTEVGLTQCLNDLDEIRERELPSVSLSRRDEIFRTLDLANLWQTAHIMASVSRERRESRGPHYREDYPDPDPQYAGSYLVEPKSPPPPGERVEYSMRLVNLTEE